MTPVTTRSPGAMRGEVIGAVGLEPFAQRLGHRIAEPRLQRLVVEREDFDGSVRLRPASD